jgi:hypothetical protein
MGNQVEAHHLAILDGQIRGIEHDLGELAGQIAELEKQRASLEAQRDDAVRLRAKIG